LHHVIVGWDTHDEQVLRGWLGARVNAVEATTWDGIASQLRFPEGRYDRMIVVIPAECGVTLYGGKRF